MPGYLLDTMVISETVKPRKSPRVVEWLAATRDSGHFLSVLSFAELHHGIDNVRAESPIRAAKLTEWAVSLEDLWRGSTLDVNLSVARLGGRFIRRLPSEQIDALLAATAAIHGLTVATRNVRHFRLFDVAVVDPYA
ncbi:MAG: type II toxin-antitoxin system VapC family toxin [Tagaea sp.]|nr:type II toxin-antitoxin system VapC family toxin [Tagaea sp.]